jgi:endonuclease/exonuclease/phosphatase (EEP) superfamily protein YafD
VATPTANRHRHLRRALLALALLGPLGLYGERISGGWLPPLTALAQIAPLLGVACVAGAALAVLAQLGRASVALIAAALALAPVAVGPLLDGATDRGAVQIVGASLGATGTVRRALPSARPVLRLLTANLGHRRTAGPTVASALRSAAADAVALQEVGPHHVAALEGLRDLYPHQRVEPRGLTGIALLARVPLGGVELVESASGRPALRADLALPGGTVHLVTAHPSAWVALLGRLDDDARDLVALADRAVARTRSDAAADAPAHAAVLAGDLNTTDRTWLHRRLRAAGLRDAWSAAGAGHGFTFPVFGRWRGVPSPPIARIDHVLHTPALVPLAIERGPKLGSDHLPVVCELGWAGAPR